MQSSRTPPPAKSSLASIRLPLYALLGVVMIMVIFTATGAILRVPDPKRFGEGLAQWMPLMALGALGVSALAHKGRKTLAWVAGVLLLAAVVASAVLVGTAIQRGKASSPQQDVRKEAPSLPTDDLVRAGGVLRHPSLGFTIPDPGAGLMFSPDHSFEPPDPGTRLWLYFDGRTQDTLAVVLIPGVPSTKQALTKLVTDWKDKHLQISTLTDEHERWVREDLRRARAYFVVDDETHVRIDAFGLRGDIGLVLISNALTAESMAALADGVKIP